MNVHTRTRGLQIKVIAHRIPQYCTHNNNSECAFKMQHSTILNVSSHNPELPSPNQPAMLQELIHKKHPETTEQNDIGCVRLCHLAEHVLSVVARVYPAVSALINFVATGVVSAQAHRSVGNPGDIVDDPTHATEPEFAQLLWHAALDAEHNQHLRGVAGEPVDVVEKLDSDVDEQLNEVDDDDADGRGEDREGDHHEQQGQTHARHEVVTASLAGRVTAAAEELDNAPLTARKRRLADAGLPLGLRAGGNLIGK